MASKAERGSLPWRLIGWGGAFALLLIPLVGSFPWSIGDYIFAAAIFALVGGTFELAVRRSGSGWYRAGVAVALATAFLLVWINGAVGVIGDEGNPANLMFLGVIAIAVAGGIGARFRAAGMAKAMTAAAGAEVVVGAVALVYGLGANQPPFFPGVLLLIGFFALTWLLSAWLFQKAARQRG
jgi:hypothetical protein